MSLIKAAFGSTQLAIFQMSSGGFEKLVGYEISIRLAKLG
jgi:hypothetical protein